MEANSIPERLLKPAEVAEVLQVSKTQVYRLMENELPCVRFGKSTVRVRAGDLTAYIEEHRINKCIDGNNSKEIQ